MEILVFALIAFLQLPLLLPARAIPDDEVLCVDTALGIFRPPYVPKARFWSHVLPEIGMQNFYYTPLSFYVLALFLKLFGTRETAVGVLHGLLRLTTAILVWSIGTQLGLPPLLNSILTLSWAIFCYGPTGRPDDLALLFVTASLYTSIAAPPTAQTAGLSGLLLGLAFLTYPAALLGSLTVAVAVVMIHPANSAIPMLLVCGAFTVATSLLWLIWVLPYWSTFKTVFLRFALPDARSDSRRESLKDVAQYIVTGVYSSSIPLRYSLIPLGVIFAVAWFAAVPSNLPGALLALGVITIHIVYLSGLRIHKTYNLLFLMAALYSLGVILFGRQAATLTDTNGVLTAALIFSAAQIAAALGLTFARVLGTTKQFRRYKLMSAQTLRAHIPAGEGVLTSVGSAYYVLADTNPVYTSASREGVTYGGVPFRWDFEDQYRWLILYAPLTTDPLIPNGKFRWNEADRTFFREHFTLDMIIDVFGRKQRRGLERYAGVPEVWFIYRYVGT